MLHYNRVHTALLQAEQTLKMALRSKCDTEAEVTALRESLELIQEAREKCRLAQKESVIGVIHGGIKM